ncbi:nucleoside kinase [Porphyromonas pogonae]|uniref:nucleoside kinase n=1 Tax=Porphyromonas pogonae TaxID=867595 RepID=UPI002E790276|nr:nucleoside kinase [Porphyromonas pogonae]
MEMITLFCKNLQRYDDFPIGSSLQEIASYYESQLGFKPINAQVNNKTTCLVAKMYEPADILFIGLAHESGMRTYMRSLSFVLSKAVEDVLPGSHLYIEHSLARGYYCEIRNSHEVTPEDVLLVKNRADEIIKQDSPFVTHMVRTEIAVEIFKAQNLLDKCNLLETIGAPYTEYVELDGYIDYYYGCLVPSTGYLKVFDFIPWGNGALMQLPQSSNPLCIEEAIPQPMMGKVFEEQNKLLKMFGAKYVGSLNKLIEKREIDMAVQVAEAVQEKQIAGIAAEIARRYTESGARIILISGPSSSGKTTFCKRLMIQLVTNYLRPHGISLDDYFVDRELTPKDDLGEYDFESLHALDLPFLNQQVKEILNNEEVTVPSFDFEQGKRIFKNKKLKLGTGDVLVMEGIHALNPDLLPDIPVESTFKIYVSALTGIALDSHNRIPSTDNRLIRRMVRDSKYRGYSAIDTIARWPSVRRGEEKWVFPYQENADAMFNSAMLYELAALRPYAEPLLLEVPCNVPEYAEAQRLLRFLAYFRFIPNRLMPNVSLIREFLGGSTFRY